MKVPRLIKEARTGARLSQSDLAVRAATSQAAISRYESGRCSPAVATLERLLAACGKRLKLEAIDGSVGARTGPVGRVLRTHKRELREALATYGVRNPRVFGSVARGDDRESSDVDLLVELPRPSYLLLAKVRAAATAALGIAADVSTESVLRPDVRDRVLTEAVPL